MGPQEQLIQWLQATAQGDKSAFAQLYKATSGKLFAVSLQLLRRRDWAEDVLQDAFVRIWHSLCKNPLITFWSKYEVLMINWS